MKGPGVDELVRQAEAGDQEERFRALRALVGTDERALVPALKALKDGSLPLKAIATRVLSSMENEVVGLLMIALLRWYPSLIGPAMEILQNLRPVSLVKDTLLKDRDYQMRILGLQLLESFGIKEGLEEPLERAFYDRDKNVRCAAIKTIASLGIKSLYWTFFETLKERDEWMIFYALSCIGRTRPEGAEEFLVPLLSHEVWYIREATIECLGALRTERSIRLLKDRLKDIQGRERRTLIRTLIKASAVEASEDFLKEALLCLKEKDLTLVKRSIQTLALFPEEEVIYRLLEWAGSIETIHPDYDELVGEVFHTLVRMQRPELLYKVIRQKDLKFRAKALGIKVIGRLRFKEAIPLLVELLKAKERDIRKASARALYNMASAETIGPLREALSDPDDYVRQWVIKALIRAGLSLEETIKIIIQEPYSSIKEEAVRELLKIHPLQRWFQQLPEEVRTLVTRNLTEERDIEIALKDPSKEVKKVALRRLAIFNPTRAMEIKEQLGDEEDELLDCILEMSLHGSNQKQERHA